MGLLYWSIVRKIMRNNERNFEIFNETNFDIYLLSEPAPAPCWEEMFGVNKFDLKTSFKVFREH